MMAKRFLVIALMLTVATTGFAYDYLISGNNVGGYYNVPPEVLHPDTTWAIPYWYDTSLGGCDFFADGQDEIEDFEVDGYESDLLDGSGDGAGAVWGVWGGNKRVDVIFDFGKVYAFSKADLRTQLSGENSGVSSFTVRVSRDHAVITNDDPNSIGWQLLGESDNVNHFSAENIVGRFTPDNPNDPNGSGEYEPVFGRYVWYEIHGVGYQVQVSEVALWGDEAPLGDTCQDMQTYGRIKAADLNADCYVDLLDFSLLTSNWMLCNDPQADCGVYITR